MLQNHETYDYQVVGVAMDSPLGHTLANAFLCKPVCYKRYVDNVFFNDKNMWRNFLVILTQVIPI